MEIATNDPTAIMDMLARHAAEDTNWDEPPLLFALGRTPQGAYGIAPARPWTGVMLNAYEQGAQLGNILEAFPKMMERHRRLAPGIDAACVALQVEFEESRQQWFPQISAGTEPCGIVLRSEGWVRSVPLDQGAPATGRSADDPDAVEILSWQAATYDDQFCTVAWMRGQAAPIFDTWSLKKGRGDGQIEERIPQAMRAMMRVSRSIAIEKYLNGNPVGI